MENPAPDNAAIPRWVHRAFRQRPKLSGCRWFRRQPALHSFL